MSDFFPDSPCPAGGSSHIPTIPDCRNDRPGLAHPIRCTLHAIELDSLAKHHEEVAVDLHRRGSDAADLLQARAAELRRLAVRARAGA